MNHAAIGAVSRSVTANGPLSVAPSSLHKDIHFMKYVFWCCIAVAGCTTTEDRAADWPTISTEIFEPSCGTAGCHSQWSQVAGVILDSRDAGCQTLVTDPPDGYGPFVVAGDPAASQLVYLLHGDEIRRMPPDGPLPEADVSLVEDWIAAGATCP
jgi:hypothetical protein